jgi:hypothetical protein
MRWRIPESVAASGRLRLPMRQGGYTPPNVVPHDEAVGVQIGEAAFGRRNLHRELRQSEFAAAAGAVGAIPWPTDDDRRPGGWETTVDQFSLYVPSNGDRLDLSLESTLCGYATGQGLVGPAHPGLVLRTGRFQLCVKTPAPVVFEAPGGDLHAANANTRSARGPASVAPLVSLTRL